MKQMKKPIFSALEVAKLVVLPGEKYFEPTAEQIGVIEASLDGPVLVVAGAGSGKTATLANRVVWLIANGYATPAQVLGLTFTKKAAAELSERVRARIEAFIENCSGEETFKTLSSEQQQQVSKLRQKVLDELEMPDVSTYNSFAVATVQEFGMAAGVNTAATLIDEASAWNLARELIVSSQDEFLYEQDSSLNEIVKQTLNLDRAVHENLSDFNRVEREALRFVETLKLPRDEKTAAKGLTGEPYADVVKRVKAVQMTALAARLASLYSQKKKELNFQEYSDQVFNAVKTVQNAKGSAATLKNRYRFVLLDEVQDTSVGQTKLLATIFAGTSVMGVGDPHQSIYGWRGASSGSLLDFHSAFKGTGNDFSKNVMTLSVSWRNPVKVLDAANKVAGPLRVSTTLEVPELLASPSAPEGDFEAGFFETVDDEAEAVAAWIEAQKQKYAREEDATAAVILRSRKLMKKFSDALTNRGIPNSIVGIGGLLTTPEVSDIVSVLRVLWYADAGNELLRILVGPKFAVGIKDVAGLQRYAKANERSLKPADSESGLNRQLVTIVDALDLLTLPKNHNFAKKFISETGMERLVEAAHMFKRLRSFVGIELSELIHIIETELLLDIELESKAKDSSAAHSARSNIFMFMQTVRGLEKSGGVTDLRSLLMWLERAVDDDAVAEHEVPVDKSFVQITTVHSAKGLEWDIVAVPRMTESEFPSANKSVQGWLKFGEIPDACRGDSKYRPQLDYSLAATSQELNKKLTDYSNEHSTLHEEEERRLAYVAVTRSKNSLFISGSFWSTKMKPEGPSPYMSTIVDLLEPDALPEESEFTENPLTGNRHEMVWPVDALGTRRESVERAAVQVLEALNTDTLTVQQEAKLLVAEAKANREKLVRKYLPERINASAFHDILADPERVAAQNMRPVPQRPYRQTRIGNIFHDWVQKRISTPSGTDLQLDFTVESEQLVTDEDALRLQQLVKNFERSRWAVKAPLFVEIELSIPFADRRAVCKLDAVYETDDGYEIVDWKTGRPPATEKEKDDRFLQLDLYRAALADYLEKDIESITATLFYVNEEEEFVREKGRNLEMLETLWQESLKDRQVF